MSRTLDFTKVKKQYLTIKLNDGKGTVLMIGTPTKNILNEFIAINDKVSEEGGADKESLDDLYDVCSKVMSFNKGGIKVTSGELSKFFDLENIMIFFRVYGEFMADVTGQKN